MKFKVNEDPKQLENGQHTGNIAKVEYKTQPYEYTDFYIKNVDNEQTTIKVGYASFISPSSQLGQLFERMGVKLIPGKEIEPEMLLGTDIVFTTIQKKAKSDGKMYARVLPESVMKSELSK